MPRDPQVLIYVGIKKFVVAIDERTGTEVWRAELKGGDFVTVSWDGEALVAANSGEVYRLDPRSGAVMWRNELKGLGRDLVTLASERVGRTAGTTEIAASKKKRDNDAAAAAAAS